MAERSKAGDCKSLVVPTRGFESRSHQVRSRLSFFFRGGVPQTDVLTFPAALALLPFLFLGGYFFFLTRGVPRVLLVFRTRAWLTRFARGVPVVPVAAGVPEFVLGVIQFVGLVAVVAGLTLVVAPAGALPPGPARPARPARPVPPGGALLVGWDRHRGVLFFAPLVGGLTAGVCTLVEGFGAVPPAGRFVFRLRGRLASLSGSVPRVGG